MQKPVKTKFLAQETARKNQGASNDITLVLKWSEAGSNRRHRPFQGRALPTELSDHLVLDDGSSGPFSATRVNS